MEALNPALHALTTVGELAGKKVVVTGSTRGIGRAIAQRLASEGAEVVIHGRRDDEAARAAEGVPGVAHGLGEVLSDAGSVDRLVDRSTEILGGLDVLVNAAGIARDRYLTRISDEDWYDSLEVNLSVPFFLTRRAAGVMKAQESGVILNVLSWAGLRGSPGQGAYSASKAGLLGLTKVAAKELGQFGVRVNGLSPVAETEMTAEMTPERRAEVLARIALGRFGNLNEIAESALFMVSPRSAYTTGMVMHVDGGMHLY